MVLRRDAGSRYPLLYQKPKHKHVIPSTYAPSFFWYNAAIEAILNGTNAIKWSIKN